MSTRQHRQQSRRDQWTAIWHNYRKFVRGTAKFQATLDNSQVDASNTVANSNIYYLTYTITTTQQMKTYYDLHAAAHTEHRDMQNLLETLTHCVLVIKEERKHLDG